MKVTNLLDKKAKRVQPRDDVQAEGVGWRTVTTEPFGKLGGVLENLYEIAPSGMLSIHANKKPGRRQFFVLQGIGEIGAMGDGEVIGVGSFISGDISEAYTVRNIGEAPLLLLYLTEFVPVIKDDLLSAALKAKEAATPEQSKPAALRADIHKVLIYFDGGEPGGNTGEGTISYGSYGIFIPNDKGEYKERKADEVVRHQFEAGMTNNEAEYLTLIRGVQGIIARIKEIGQAPADWHIDIKGDSNLVVNQVNGAWKVKAEHLKAYTSEAQELLKQFGSYTLTWHDRSNSVRVLGH